MGKKWKKVKRTLWNSKHVEGGGIPDEVEIPCGECDMGVYSEMAMLNRKAREFSVMTTEERNKNMPRCKKHDRPCIGAKHFSQTIAQIDGEIERKCNHSYMWYNLTESICRKCGNKIPANNFPG